MYHRFGENKYPTTNTTIEQFITHTNELVKDKYDVIRLDKVIKGLRGEINLKDRTVSITIDDAYLSLTNSFVCIINCSIVVFVVGYLFSPNL